MSHTHSPFVLLSSQINVLYDDSLFASNRVHSRFLDHRDHLFLFLRQRWEDLFNARFDVLLYDLTRTEPSPCSADFLKTVIENKGLAKSKPRNRESRAKDIPLTDEI
jgi:hypothetical protein